MRILAFVSGAHPVHITWFKSVRALILPTLVGHKIHANLNIAFGAIPPKLTGLTLVLSKNCIKILETPIIEVLARKACLP